MKVTMDPDPFLAGFRNYMSGPLLDHVFTTYKLMHVHQMVDFVRSKHAWFGDFSYKKMTVMVAVGLLHGLVDESDPDVDFPHSFQAFQRAEGTQKAHPGRDWCQLVLALLGEPQWAVIGDTFPVGCHPQASVDNPNFQDPRYSTELGMCHDEYLYQVMVFHKFSLPLEASYKIRFHSFCPWHMGSDYQQWCSKQDLAMPEFNLTKCPGLPDMEKLQPYYQGLLDKYCPGSLSR
uniref:Inositol oxygenase n=1 Tax=Aotus nancymaae TaxID=37293 RepID=A0A2K5C5I3_AOTNA